MNAYEFVLALVLMIAVISIIKHRMGIRPRQMSGCGSSDEDSNETLRLREEVRTLQERIKVLERITVEKENSLAREIESLRDR